MKLHLNHRKEVQEYSYLCYCGSQFKSYCYLIAYRSLFQLNMLLLVALLINKGLWHITE